MNGTCCFGPPMMMRHATVPRAPRLEAITSKKGPGSNGSEKMGKAGPSTRRVPTSGNVRTNRDNNNNNNDGSDERYTILQKKVEDLERVHRQDKEAHAVQLERLQQEARTREEELDLCHTTLRRVTSAFAQLCTQSVARNKYEEAVYAHLGVSWDAARWERKARNSDAQVVELVAMLRGMRELQQIHHNERNALLEEVQWLRECGSHERTERRELLVQAEEAVHLRNVADNALDDAQKADALRKNASVVADDLKRRAEIMRGEIVALTDDVRSLRGAETKAAQLKEQLTDTLHREESLRSQVDALTAELAGTEALHDAYARLSNEVDELLTRNALAEDVAAQLSQFNAQILGHRNPNQRIAYVERIRNELADVRTKLALLAREHEVLQADKGELVREVDMYKSVGAAPRGVTTRVQRVNRDEILDMIPAEDEMTLDELVY